jgi:hypothetical protein
MLDELTQIEAVEVLGDQRVRAKTRVPVLTGLTTRSVVMIGERTRDLLDTLKSNLRATSKPFFEGTAVLDEADLEMVSLVRREIAEQGENFITGANSLLSRYCSRQKRSMSKPSVKCRLGVTVYYFQGDIEKPPEPKVEAVRRKNFQRKRRTTSGKRTSRANGRSVLKL